MAGLPTAPSRPLPFVNLLLTGATGFVGRNLLLEALATGSEVCAPVRDPDKLRRQIASEGVPDLPANLKALPADPASWPALPVTHAVLGAGVLFARTRDEYFATNVEWTLRVLRKLPDACRVVLLSSQSAGGPTPLGQQARTIEDPDSPITWYGESKLALERAIRTEFPGRSIAILRPPMILGPRDSATLPLFRMARGLVRIKPGWRTKSYSFIAVQDLVRAIHAALENPLPTDRSFYVSASTPITDWDLMAEAAAACRARGLTIPIPQTAVKALAAVVDAVPRLRVQTPSLTRDRAREIWPDRWVVDPSAFSTQTGWQASLSLRAALQTAYDHYRQEGSL